MHVGSKATLNIFPLTFSHFCSMLRKMKQDVRFFASDEMLGKMNQDVRFFSSDEMLRKINQDVRFLAVMNC